MKIWTIQSREAYVNLVKTGTLKSNNDILNWPDLIQLKHGYDWMVGQMKKRLGPPSDESIQYPIWGWYMIDGNNKKPDLRLSGYAERGTELVLMKVNIPDNQVLLSDFDLFHYVINYAHAAKNANEENAFEYLLNHFSIKDDDITNFNITNDKIDYIRKKIIESWDVIFDINGKDNGDFFSTDKSIQATFWELKIGQVLKTIPFTAK